MILSEHIEQVSKMHCKYKNKKYLLAAALEHHQQILSSWDQAAESHP